AANSQGRGGAGGDQPEHRAQGLPRTGIRGPGGTAPGAGDVRDQDIERRVARRARTAAPGPARVVAQGAAGRPRRRKHRSVVREHVRYLDRGEVVTDETEEDA